MRVRVETTAAGWDVFPEGWPRRVFDLIAETWPSVRIATRSEAEERITGKLHTALMDRWFAEQKEWFPTIEQPCVDAAGNYVGFTDLRFAIFARPPHRCIFVVENKRLNVASEETKYAARYVEDGIARFITGKYSPDMPCGGMVGFVMDGNCREARKRIASAIAARHPLLAMAQDANLDRDTNLPCAPDNGRTEHLRNGSLFTMKHLLLPVEL
jgi:hypothetical protein